MVSVLPCAIVLPLVTKLSTGGASLSMIVSVLVAGLPSVALVGVPSVMTTVSSGSSSASLTRFTVMLAVVAPAGITSGLAEVEKSAGLAAVPLMVNGTVTALADAADS